MGTTTLAIIGLCVVVVYQDRQRPGTAGERKRDQNREHNPLTVITPGGVALGRADGIAMAGLAINVLALVAIHGVIANETNDPLGQKVLQQETAEQAGQL